MIRAGLLALLSHWRRTPLQLFTLVAGLALATALWSGVQAVNAEARASYDAAAATMGEGQFAQITARDGGLIPQARFAVLRRAGWLVSPVVEGRSGDVRIIGIEPLTAPGGFGPITLAQENLPDMVGGLLFGQEDALAGFVIDSARKIVVPDMPPSVVMTDIGFAQVLLGQEGQVSRFVVSPIQPILQRDLTEIAPELALQPAQAGNDIAQLTDSFHLNLTAFGLLAFAVGIFIVHGAIGLAFEQRRPVLRTLRALGLPLRTLMLLLAGELLVLALVAGTIGIALGYVIAAALLPDVAATLSGLYGADVNGTLQLRAEWWLSGLAIAVGGTALAAISALIGLARMPLLAGAHPRALAMRSGRMRVWQAVVALTLFAIAVGALTLSAGLLAGFVLLASLLIGAALVMPILLDLILRLFAGFARRPLAEWFWADTRQQLSGLTLALMALLLAMAANVGVSTMVSSFRLTFVGFLDQRLAAEYYVYADDADHAAALEDFVTPRVDAVLPIQNVTQSVRGVPAEIHGPTPHQTYRENWTFLDGASDAWTQIEAGNGAAINEQLARRAGITVGETIMIAGRPFDVVGIHGDYGNPIGQVLITNEQFAALFPETKPLRFALRLPPEDVAALEAALRDDFGLAPANMINQAGIKAFSLEVFDRTFTVTGALNVLTLAVAGFAILMSLLTLASMRLPQLAPVWAMGLTRVQIGRVELLRALLLAVLTALLALPLGLGLAWVLLSVVNVEAFGWRLPMFLFPGAYLRLGLLALLAAALAALLPALRLARTPPTVLLKVFSNER